MLIGGGLTMSRFDEDSDHMPTHGSTLLERIVARFESAWQQGEQPAIDDYLQSDGPGSQEILVELVHVDLEFRLKAGEGARVESYLERYSALGEDRSTKCQLIVAEYNLRLRDEPDLSAEQYYQRFPDDQEELRELFASALSTQADFSRKLDGPQSSSIRIQSRLRIDENSLPMSFGRFELVALIGRGAFGAVYRAYDPQLVRDVAIKIPKPRMVETRSQVNRFLREARAGAKLTHRNICPIYDVGEHQGSYYIVMGYIAGTPLSDFIKPQNPIPETTAARLVLKLTAALAEAHRQGIIHRDLKPSNIIIDERRREPIILDFGLAKDLLNPDAQTTVTGEILGTPAYMSPEQAHGLRSQIGPKTDIYSLGVVLYHLLTGRIPFEGSTAEVVVGVLDKVPEPPSQHRPGLDSALESTCLKAMAKKPADRFASMAEFGEALKAYLRDLDRTAQPVSADRRGTREARPKAVASVNESTQPALSEHVNVSAPAEWRNAAELEALAPPAYLPMTGQRRESTDNSKLITIAAAVSGLAIILMLAGILLSQYLSRKPADEPLVVIQSDDESKPPVTETTAPPEESSLPSGHASTDARITDGAEDLDGPPLSLTELLARQSQESSIGETAEEVRRAEPPPTDKTTDAASATASPKRPEPGGLGPSQGMESDRARTWNLNDGRSFEAEFIRYDPDSTLVTWQTTDGAFVDCRLTELPEEDRQLVLAKAQDALQAKFETLVAEARASMGDGDYDRAKRVLTSASRMVDEQVRASFMLGLLAALVDNDFDKAKTSFAHCVERLPNSGIVLNNLAITEIQNREFSDAFRHWEKVLVSEQDDQVIAVIAHNTDILLQYIERHPGAAPPVHKENLRKLRDAAVKLSGGETDSDTGWLYLDVQLEADGTLRPANSRSIGTFELEDHQCRFCNVCRGCGLVKCPDKNCRQGYEGRDNRRVPCDTCQGRKSVPCPHCSGGIRG